MRASRDLQWFLTGFRRHAGASLALASLLGLFLIQPFHAPAPAGAATPVFTAASATGSGPAPQHAAHDPDACPVCRATAQSRLGLRGRAQTDPVAVSGASVALTVIAPAPARRAPELHRASPRAPPAAFLVPSA